MLDELIPDLKIIYENIIGLLDNGKINVLNIAGDSGAGKSSLLSYIVQYLRTNELDIIILKGDLKKTEIEYYPLDEYLERSRKIKKLGKDVISNLFENIPLVGKSFKSIIENVDIENYIKRQNILECDECRRHYDFSLQLISLLNKKKTFYILCDDIQYFDRSTIDYLNHVYLKLKLALNTSAEIIFITTINTSVPGSHQKYIDGKQDTITIPLPSRNDIINILKFWKTGRSFSNSEIDMIYSATGGHLYLLKNISEYMQVNNDEENQIECSNNLLCRLIEERLLSFGNTSQDAKNLLCSLSRIGEHASVSELSCVLDNPLNLNNILNASQNHNMLTVKDDYVYFCHEIVQKAFFDLGSEDVDLFYGKFANCLKVLSPSHYAKRAMIACKAKNFKLADTLYALYACQKMRKGLFSEINDITNRFQSNNKSSLTSLIEEISIGYKLTFDGKNQEALIHLQSMSPCHDLLWFEQQYLIAVIQFKGNVVNQYKEALCALETIIAATEDEEMDIWARCMLLKQVLEMELFKCEEAIKTRNAFQLKMSKRASYDKEARKTLNTMDLYSDVIDRHEVAHKKLLRVSLLLETEVQNGNYDSIFDLYIALCNLSGNSLIIAEYSKGYEAATKAMQIVNRFDYIRFPHIEACLNNMLLSLYFLDHSVLNNIINKYYKLLNTASDEDDILIRLNYAGLLLMTGQSDGANNAIGFMTVDEDDFDVYYVYYYRFNIALIRYFKGERKQAISDMKNLRTLLPNVSNIIGKYYLKHYDAVINLLIAEDYNSFASLQMAFSEENPTYLSSTWEKFKYVYLFSDLQIWTPF